MSDQPATAAASTFLFESADPARDKTAFFDQLRQFGQSARWSSPILNEVELILEELWTNLLSYAWTEGGQPDVRVQIDSDSRRAVILLEDNGAPFDPAARPDPDVTRPAEERPVGGLGIFMVKKLSRSLHSERRCGRNILRVEKDLTRPVLAK